MKFTRREMPVLNGQAMQVMEHGGLAYHVMPDGLGYRVSLFHLGLRLVINLESAAAARAKVAELLPLCDWMQIGAPGDVPQSVIQKLWEMRTLRPGEK